MGEVIDRVGGPPCAKAAHRPKNPIKKNKENIHKKSVWEQTDGPLHYGLWTLKVVVAIMTTPYCDRPTCWRCVSRCDANEALCEQRPAMVVCSSMLLTGID